MISNLERLSKARDLIAAGFCKGALALDKDGHGTQPGTPEAVSHCILGALIGADSHIAGLRMEHNTFSWLITPQLPEKWLKRNKYPDMCTIVDFNNANETTQADVVGLLDRTIAALR